MAQGMRDIKRRIRSVSNTKKITKAMELVSSAKLRKARGRLEKTRPYFDTVVRSINDILSNTDGVRHPLLTKRDVKKVLYIVLTSDRGLCGGYNSNVLKLVEKSDRDKSEIAIISIGSQAKSYFERRNYDIKQSFTQISENPTYADALKIGSLALKLYKDGEIDEINLVYTSFVSTVTYQPKVLKLLPAENLKSEDKSKRTLVEYEPSPEAVLGYLIPKYIYSAIYGGLIESSASEQGSRRTAMESATDNAEEMIDKLQLSYNRARQAAITQEISEIVGGAGALE
ncbi:ATP synthase F1 subunit gamma [Abyssisolibacter fermentans]|uniref:ATP synthase F1 subunit gamma n=1 Tax=Abyssisolibacter fermentans TaxID=1766203 RepID=UPI00082CDD34|nr:ATP synthase F1 subunit gamma [Abyssisolibacter fermentans]